MCAHASLDGSLPRTRQVHLHSRGVLVGAEGEKIKEGHSRPEVERERCTEVNERPTAGAGGSERDEEGGGGGEFKPAFETSQTPYSDLAYLLSRSAIDRCGY